MMRRFRCTGTSVILFIAACAGCLFETTPPERRTTGGDDPEIDPTAVTITGLVQLFDRQDQDVSAGPYWYVQAVWYRADTNRDGQPEVVRTMIARAGFDGVYRISYPANQVVRVDIRARQCVVDPDALQGCCLADPPCTGPACSVWLPPVAVTVHGPGHQQRNLLVRCDFVP